MEIELDMIRTDGGTQPRVQLDLFTVQEYATAMQEGAQFPPVTLFFDGQAYWLADGFHRYEAARQLGHAAIAAEIRNGGLRDAILYSVGANAAHGLKRTQADKRHAVLTLLNDPDWQTWSNREIARRCYVSDVLVMQLRETITANISSDRTYPTRWGTVATMNTANIGRPAAVITTHEPLPIVALEPVFSVQIERQRPMIPMVDAEPDADHELPAPVAVVNPPVRYPLAIVVSRPTWEKWQQYKASVNVSSDTAAFELILEGLWQRLDA